MKIVIMAAISIVIAFSAGLALAEDGTGTLVVENAFEIKYKRSRQIIEAGEYKAKMNIDYTGILLRKILSFQIETSPKSLIGSLKFVKRTDNLQGQEFTATRADIYEEKITSEEMRENRSCVAYTFYTQENCRVISTIECNFGSSFAGPCTGGTRTRNELVCDSVQHNIPGRQDVVFHKSLDLKHPRIVIKDKKSAEVMATFSLPTESRPSEKIISKTRCM